MNLFFKRYENGDFKYQHVIFELLTSHHSELKNHKVFDMDTDPFVEDCFIMIQLLWGICSKQLSDELKNIKNKKIMIINHGYSFVNKDGLESLRNLRDWLNDAGFDTNCIYIICQFKNEVPIINQHIPTAKVHVMDEWLVEFMQSRDVISRLKTSWVKNNNLPIKKFSIFSRRYTKERFDFFIDLISKNLLQDSYFTFSNNYGCSLLESIDINELKSNIPDRLNQSKSNIETWIEGIPYSTPGKLLDPNPNDINNMIEHSKLNIVYETNPIKSPSMISEKTYKAMFFKKPFIVVCHPYTLKLLKDCGYMTFSPWINESYDEIEDYQERAVAILNEIERLNSLSDTELDLIIEQCNHVIEHNYNWMISEYKNSLIWPEEFILSNI